MKAELCKLLKKVLLILTVLSSCFSASSTHILSITPSSISFGNQIINSSVEGDVTITNSGSGVIQVQAVTLAAANGFALTGWSVYHDVSHGGYSVPAAIGRESTATAAGYAALEGTAYLIVVVGCPPASAAILAVGVGLLVGQLTGTLYDKVTHHGRR